MADKIRDWLTEQYPNSDCGSPMEALFNAAYCLMRPGILGHEHYRLTLQHPIGKYKADFCFVVAVDPEGVKRLVVEIDGHDFHERTKEQARHDKQRDRFMLAAGYEVMRFTGSEVWANPFACVKEAAIRCHVLRYGETPKSAGFKAMLEDMRKFFADDSR